MPLLVLEDKDIERIGSLAAEGSNVVGLFERLPAALHDPVAGAVLDERPPVEMLRYSFPAVPTARRPPARR
jgi:hypothetical protein